MGFAEPTGLEVTWDAPPSCPDEATATAQILARLPTEAARRPVRAHARVVEEANGTWRVDIELYDDDGVGTRSLHADSCAEALTATAVVVAIAVDPEAVPPPPQDDDAVPAPPEERSPEGPGEQTPSAERPAEPVDLTAPDEAPDASPSTESSIAESSSTEPAPTRSRPLGGWSLGVRGGLDYGALPSPAAHLFGHLGLFGRRWHVLGGALHRIQTEASAQVPQTAGGRFRLTAGRLGAGPRLAWGRFGLPLHAGVELGAIWARGTGAVEPQTTRRLWAAAIASAGVAWTPIPAVALELGLDGVLPLARPSFTLGESIEVLTVGRGALRAWLGIAGHFSL